MSPRRWPQAEVGLVLAILVGVCLAYDRCRSGHKLEMISAHGKVLIPEGICGSHVHYEDLQHPPRIRVANITWNDEYSLFLLRNNTNATYTVMWQLAHIRPFGEFLTNNKSTPLPVVVEYSKPDFPANYTILVYKHLDKLIAYDDFKWPGSRLVKPSVLDNMVNNSLEEISRVGYTVVDVLPHRHVPHYPLEPPAGPATRLPHPYPHPTSTPGPQADDRPWLRPADQPRSDHGQIGFHQPNFTTPSPIKLPTNMTRLDIHMDQYHPLNQTNQTKSHGPPYHILRQRSAAGQNFASPTFLSLSLLSVLLVSARLV